MAEKASFVLYHDIREPLKLLTDEDRGKLFFAILDYSEFGVLPEFDGALQMAFAFIRTAIDRDTAAWEDKIEKRREAGSKGGKQRVANQANAKFALDSQANEANQAVPVPAPVPVSDRERGTGKPSKRSRFVPPSIEEVREYVQAKGLRISPDAFWDHYEACGWVQGRGKPIKDWRAAARLWDRRDKERSTDTQQDLSDWQRRFYGKETAT